MLSCIYIDDILVKIVEGQCTNITNSVATTNISINFVKAHKGVLFTHVSFIGLIFFNIIISLKK